MLNNRSLQVKLVKTPKNTNDTSEVEERTPLISAEDVNAVIQQVAFGVLLIIAANTVSKIAINKFS